MRPGAPTSEPLRAARPPSSSRGSRSRPAPPPPAVPTPPAMKRLEPALFGAALALADATALTAAIPLAYWLRFGSGILPTPLGTPALSAYLGTAPVVA